MTITEAIETIRTVVPATERSVFITIEVADYDHYAIDDPARLRIQFRVWDGRDGFYGPNLDTAVQKCILANVPDQAKIEDAETLAAEAATLAPVEQITEAET